MRSKRVQLVKFKQEVVAQLTDEVLLKARAQVLAMQQLASFEPRPGPPDALTIALLKKIPFLAGFLRSVDGTGVAVSKFAYLQGNQLAGSVNTGFRIAAAVIALFDFILISTVYLVAWSSGQPLQLSPSQKAKWLYSAIVLGLSLAGLLAPVAFAPYIALTAATLACAVSIFTFGKLFYDRYKTNKLLQRNWQKIEAAEFELQLMMQAAQKLDELLNDPNKKRSYLAYVNHVQALQEDMDQKKEAIQKIYDKQLKYLQRLEELGWSAVLHKTIGIGLATVALIGLVLALSFPLTGLIIFGASTAVGGLYLLTCIAYMCAPYLKEKIKQCVNRYTSKKIIEIELDEFPLQKGPLLQREAQIAVKPLVKAELTETRGLRLFDRKRTRETEAALDSQSRECSQLNKEALPTSCSKLKLN